MALDSVHFCLRQFVATGHRLGTAWVLGHGTFDLGLLEDLHGGLVKGVALGGLAIPTSS